MSDSQDPASTNPYQAPTTAWNDPASGGPSHSELQHTALLLRQTRPWVRFISVLCWIGGVLMIVVLIGMAIVIAAEIIPGDAFPPAMLAIYGVGALFYIPPAIFLWRYASRITRFEQSLAVNDMNAALEAQKAFWRFVGILFAVILVIYVVLIVVGAGIGVMA